MTKTIEVSIRDFALPSPRAGSIEANSGFDRAADVGREIHLREQRRLAKADPSYKAEVRISREFARAGYRFRLGGRMDGYYETTPPRIEEIKAAFEARELAAAIARAPMVHPYALQLMTYGYLLWLEKGVSSQLEFRFVSMRDGKTELVALAFDLPTYESWFDRRMQELVEEAGRCESRVRRRRKIAARFVFPFETPRAGQLALVRTIESGMKEGERILLQAPTGLGKTAGVLYPTLRESLARGQKVVYVTPKNSQHAVAEAAADQFRTSGAKLKSMTITAKAKICLKDEPFCDPQYCEFARDYYEKVHQKDLPGLLEKKKSLSARTFRKIGIEHVVCPFELQFDAARFADLVICDYNYVFAPRTSFGRLAVTEFGQNGRPNLVIDEVHNLPARAMGYYSPSASTAELFKMRARGESLAREFLAPFQSLIGNCIATIEACRPADASAGARISPPVEAFMAQEAAIHSFRSRYLASDTPIGRRDVVLDLSLYWSGFVEALMLAVDPERTEFFAMYAPEPTGGAIRITCCDPSKLLADRYDDYDQIVGFSATLKPFDYYGRLSGLDLKRLRIEECASPFPAQNRKLLIIPQVSTKYSDRKRNAPRIAEAISRIAAVRKGNYFAFFPSFEFLESVHAIFAAPPGFTLLRQEREMSKGRIDAVLDALRAGVTPTIVFAVQGGVFSEGLDYPGDTLIGAFVIGPPLPPFSGDREEMRRYYEDKYGAGFDYAYAFPAMAKAVQSAGRVIRSETDRGLIVLMDSRFVTPAYARSMPSDWFEKSPDELVSKSILREVEDFWGSETAERTE